MKTRVFIIALGLGVLIMACHKDSATVAPATPTSQNSIQNRHNAMRFTGDSTEVAGGSQFITMSTANTMIGSYLSSIHSSSNDSDVQSFSVNADSLRAYLANPAIKNVKLMFAHTMAYINAGNTGVYAGYQSGAITIVIAAYDNAGNYVYLQGNGGNCVLDHCFPCPYSCPEGAAGNSLLQ